MSKISLLLLAGVLIGFSRSTSCQAQTPITWAVLKDVEYKRKYNSNYDMYFLKAKFSGKIKNLDNTEVQLKGYIIPMDTEGNAYVLSANPYSSCFFCGQAGPESVVEIKLRKKGVRYTLDKVMTFSGILIIRDEVYDLTYALEDAVPVNN